MRNVATNEVLKRYLDTLKGSMFKIYTSSREKQKIICITTVKYIRAN